MDEDWVSIEKFKEGDLSGFHEIFAKYRARTVNLAYRFVKNKEAAEDIAQDVLLKVYEKKVSVNLKAKFSTWLYQVTVNASRDYLRLKSSHLLSLNEPPGGENGQAARLEKLADPSSLSSSQILEAAELLEFVSKEVDALPEKLRSCVLLYQFEEMSYEEIAGILRISQKAVERRLYRAKQILRDKLGNRLCRQ